jgi:hypothetical protein
MNADDRMRFAPGETEEGAPAPDTTGIPEDDAVRKDMSYSPASETETAHKQADALPDTIDDDIDPDDVRAVPGTGGPDDVGDVDIDPGELNLPFRTE